MRKGDRIMGIQQFVGILAINENIIYNEYHRMIMEDSKGEKHDQ